MPASRTTARSDGRRTAPIGLGAIVLSELGGLVAVLGPIQNGLVLLAPVPPLIAYLMFRRRTDGLREIAAEALNFQITAVVVMLVFEILGYVVPTAIVTAGDTQNALLAYIGALAAVGVVALADLAFSIVAVARIGAGHDYRFPVAFRPVH
jgi:uncharacterized Tic20 family protein